MARGKVKFFNRSKNFGFIVGEDGEDYFVHGTAVDGYIKDEEEVEFAAVESDKGKRASDVKKIEQA